MTKKGRVRYAVKMTKLYNVILSEVSDSERNRRIYKEDSATSAPPALRMTKKGRVRYAVKMTKLYNVILSGASDSERNRRIYKEDSSTSAPPTLRMTKKGVFATRSE